MSAAHLELWQYARSVLPSLSYPYFMGMTGLAGRLEFVSLSCRCPETLPPPNELVLGLAALGLAFVEHLQPNTAGPTTVRRIKGPISRRSAREIGAAAWMAAELLQPPAPHSSGCELAIGWKYVGVQAIERLAKALEARSRWTGKARANVLGLVSDWAARIETAGLFCSELAGASRTPYAIRLNRAANLLATAAEVGVELCKGLEANRLKLAGAASRIQWMADCTTCSAYILIEAACRGDHLAGQMSVVLSEPATEALGGQDLQEVIYLARSGAPPFRRLAAMRLAGSRSPQSVATLGQLLFDPVPAIARTALFALVELVWDDAAVQIGRALNGLAQDDHPPDLLMASMMLTLAEFGASPVPALTEEARQRIEQLQTALPLTWRVLTTLSR